MCSPAWLPALVLLRDCGNWDSYIDVLYMYFKRDFVQEQPVHCGKKLALKRHPLVDGREATFWHLITEGPKSTPILRSGLILSGRTTQRSLLPGHSTHPHQGMSDGLMRKCFLVSF